MNTVDFIIAPDTHDIKTCQNVSQGHPFRANLPISALAMTVEADLVTETTIQDDIRLFTLSFVTFFLGFSLFIW